MEKMKQVLESRKKKIEGKRAKKEEQVLERQKEVDRAMTKEKGVRSDIISTRDAVVAIINKKVDLLLIDVCEKTQKQVQDLRSDIKSKNMEIDMCKQDWELLDQGLKSESELEVFQLYERYRRETDDIEEDDFPTSTRGDIIWRRDVELLKEIGEIDLGEIVMPECNSLTSHMTSLDLSSTPVLEDTILVKLPDDSSTTILDVVSLDFDDMSTVVVTDQSNRCLKSFYNRNTTRSHSILTLDGVPRCLTVLKKNHVAVTVPVSNQIALVEVNPDLKLLSTIKTKKQYISITSLTGSTLAVGCRDPPGVEILDMRGHVLKSISPQINNKPVITSPWFICTTGDGKIVVSDQNMSVVCVSQEGDVVFRYTGSDLRGTPAGLVATDTGDILVADCCGNSSILHLTPTKQFVRKFLTLTGYVTGLCVGSGGRLYVCENPGVVRVYRCSK